MNCAVRMTLSIYRIISMVNLTLKAYTKKRHIGRYGGEEFFLISPDAAERQAIKTKKRIHKELFGCPIEGLHLL